MTCARRPSCKSSTGGSSVLRPAYHRRLRLASTADCHPPTLQTSQATPDSHQLLCYMDHLLRVLFPLVSWCGQQLSE